MQEQLEQIIARTQASLNKYKKIITESHTMLGFKDKQIEFLKAKLELYEKHFGKIGVWITNMIFFLFSIQNSEQDYMESI